MTATKEVITAKQFFETKSPKEVVLYVDKTMDIVERIMQLLKAKNWSQKDLAEALNKQPSEISKWLSASHNFTLKTLTKIEAVLDAEIIAIK